MDPFAQYTAKSWSNPVWCANRRIDDTSDFYWLFGLGAVALLFIPRNKDAGGAFFLAECLLWGTYLGILVGAYVCWRICRSRLREPKAET